ncbi:MAG: hypothetical protein LC804_28170 [Acidobacteria bacterium]|nr:hypothetical protein [Acidobacteriota bacterium]
MGPRFRMSVLGLVCVDAEPFPVGNLFIRLNRKLDGEDGVLRCSEQPADGGGGVPRNFVLRVNSDQACQILSDPLAGLPVTDNVGQPWTSGAGACIVARNDNPRIRLGTLYKSRAKTTPVDFLLVMFEHPVSFEVRSDTARRSPSMLWIQRGKSSSTTERSDS